MHAKIEITFVLPRTPNFVSNDPNNARCFVRFNLNIPNVSGNSMTANCDNFSFPYVTNCNYHVVLYYIWRRVKFHYNTRFIGRRRDRDVASVTNTGTWFVSGCRARITNFAFMQINDTLYHDYNSAFVSDFMYTGHNYSIRKFNRNPRSLEINIGNMHVSDVLLKFIQEYWSCILGIFAE